MLGRDQKISRKKTDLETLFKINKAVNEVKGCEVESEEAAFWL